MLESDFQGGLNGSQDNFEDEDLDNLDGNGGLNQTNNDQKAKDAAQTKTSLLNQKAKQ